MTHRASASPHPARRYPAGPGRAARTGWLLVLAVLGLLEAQGVRADPPPKRAQVTREAQGKKARRARRQKRPERAAAPAPASEGTSRERGPAREGESSAASAAARAAQEAAQSENSEIIKEGDTSVKVMKFTGLDIEGRLKSPQLLYFVSRIHAEFDRPKLPHRSFMPELSRSAEQEPLR